jgi:hypothetical protein
MTVYISSKDKALGLSTWLFDSVKRLGKIVFNDLSLQEQESLELLPQVNLIDARVQSNFIGHDYFWSNPAVSSDLILLLRDNRAPGKENGRPLTRLSDNFWQLNRDYPMNINDGQ